MSEVAIEAGAIQPNGFLIALSSDWLICRASANVEQFVGKPFDQVFDRHVNSLLCPDAVHAIRNRLALLRDGNVVERLFRCALLGDERLFDLAMHNSDDTIILEAIPSTEQPYGDATGTVSGMIASVDRASDLARFFAESARQIRALTGYDRVVVTRQLPNGAVEGLAESNRSGAGNPPTEMKPFSPFQNGRTLRVVADRDAAPVSVLPAVDEQGQAPDLTLSVLRTLSGGDRDYLGVVGARAWMSIAIIIEGKVWGHFECFHATPRCPSFERRSVVELFARIFAMRLEVRQLKLLLENKGNGAPSQA